MRKMFSEKQIKKMVEESSTEIVSALNGQNISPKDINASGDITADSIIENMSGYSYRIGTPPEGLTLTPVYMGCVKNGNKLTIVHFMEITRTDDITGNDFAGLGDWTIPEEIGNKLIPYTISGQPAIDNKVVALFSSASSSGVSKTIVFNKQNSTTLRAYFYGIKSLNLNTTYIFRLESTFLLSENLVPEE